MALYPFHWGDFLNEYISNWPYNVEESVGRPRKKWQKRWRENENLHIIHGKTTFNK